MPATTKRPGAAHRRRDDGLEALEIGGKPSVMSRRGSVSALGAMGDPDLRSVQLNAERTYLGGNARALFGIPASAVAAPAPDPAPAGPVD